MTDLATLEEYTTRFRQAYRVTPTAGGVNVSFPCPFCAERDWWEVELGEGRGQAHPHHCIACGRSATLTVSQGDVSLVQVSGPDAPAWMPAMRDDRPESARVRSEGRLEMPVVVKRALRTPPGMRGIDP